MSSHLFSPLKIRDLTIRNRIFVSPMCMYSAAEGMPNDWHLVHLGSRAAGGAGLVIAEATAVAPEGRITPADTGIWNDQQGDAWARVARFIKQQGAAAAIQLAHAGRKASTAAPWDGGKAIDTTKGGWQPVGPGSAPFDHGHAYPTAMTFEQIQTTVDAFAAAARRALAAGFDIVEIHMAHGYLLHSFLSALSNDRRDDYGGSLENRMRFPLAVIGAVRAAWPMSKPLFVRISATDWAEGGWDIGQSIDLARRLKAEGVDLVDCSTGGLVPRAQVPTGAGYQVPFAEGIRREAGILTGAVGLITTPAQAEDILKNERADAVLMARELLRNPHWPLWAADQLGETIPWPKQYERARPMR